jgi:hypothetical protein
VNVNVPRCVAPFVATVSTDDDVVELGFHDEVEFAGRPDTDSVTACENPPVGFTVTV